MTPTQRTRVVALAKEQAALIVLDYPATLDPDEAWDALNREFPDNDEADDKTPMDELFERTYRHELAKRWVAATAPERDPAHSMGCRGLAEAALGATEAIADGLAEQLAELVAEVRRGMANLVGVTGEQWL